MVELRKTIGLLALPVALSLLLDAIFYTGFFASDDSGYLSAAAVILRGAPMPAQVGSVRLGMMLPIAGVYWLTDGRAHLIAAAFALLHPALVAIVYLTGTLVHGSTVGRVAAWLTAICPFAYVFAGAVLPDLITTFWIVSSFLFLSLALRRGQTAWAAAAGVALGLGYSAKEIALVMIVPLFAAVLVDARSDRRRAIRFGAMLVGGVGIVVVLETLALRLLTGEWTTHLGVLMSAATQQHLTEVAAQQGVGPFERFHAVFMELKLIGPLWIWMLVLSVVAYLRVPDRSLPLALFVIWAFGYLTWGTVSLSSYNPAPIQSRYFLVAFVLASLPIARVLVAMGARLKRPRVAALVLTLSLGAWCAGEVARNRERAGDIYAAWTVRGVEDAYRSASQLRPELPVVLSPEYEWSLDGMLQHRPRNLITIYSWDRDRFPPPPFIFVGPGKSYSEDELRSMLSGPADITTLDIVYPRRRLERLWTGLSEFFVVGPRPVSGTWYWHTHETLVQLVEPSGGERRRGRPITSAPLYPSRGLTMRRVDSGHVLAWSEKEVATAQLFDQVPYPHPPTHDGSRLRDLEASACFELDYVAIEGSVRLETELQLFGRDESESVLTTIAPIQLLQSSSTTVALAGAAPWKIRSFRISLDVSAAEGPGQLLVGHPRQVTCADSGTR